MENRTPGIPESCKIMQNTGLPINNYNRDQGEEGFFFSSSKKRARALVEKSRSYDLRRLLFGAMAAAARLGREEPFPQTSFSTD